MENREIKFRVWDNVDYMSSPFTLQDLQERKIQFASDCIVMQFTGLLDKNGKEIYEGDIVCHKTYDKSIVRNIIVFEFGSFKTKPIYEIAILDHRDWYHIEVIGNIHQHPELLTTKPQGK